MLRRLLVLALLALPGGVAAHAAASQPSLASSFDPLRETLWPAAQAKGISRATFDAAFQGLSPDPRVIAASSAQPEYGKPFGDYVNAVASKSRIEEGTRDAKQRAHTLARLEKKFGVDRWIICAIWGAESSYGEDKDNYDVIVALATLAAAGYRAPLFSDELLSALSMVQQHISRKKMVGSWAGAMGQRQFMPSDFMDYAVAFSGKGQPDIWASVPDSLASIANYLHRMGWVAGLPWGFEVTIPAGFDYRRSRGSFGEWSTRGIKRADGAAMPASGNAVLFFPTGAKGPAFLVTDNFVVLKRYNNADVYALGVAYLADRLRRLGPIKAAWPSGEYELSRDERIALQYKLKELGYPVDDFEGHFDFDFRDAVRDVQQKFGMVPDGYPTLALLKKLGARVQ